MRNIHTPAMSGLLWLLSQSSGMPTEWPGGGTSAAQVRPDESVALYHALAAAQCRFEERCAATRGRLWSSLDVCLAVRAGWLGALAKGAAAGPSRDESWLTVYRIPDRDRALGCAQAVALTTPCEVFVAIAEEPMCDGVVQLVNGKQEGEACNRSVPSRLQGLRCADTGSGCGVCEPTAIRKRTGEACSSPAVCPSASCEDNVCGAPLVLGQRCDPSHFCVPGLQCRGGVCESPYAQEGQPCTRQVDCLAGLSCADDPSGAMTCQDVWLRDGESCTGEGSRCLSACIPNADGGHTCATPERARGPGEACLGHNPGWGCAAGTHAEEDANGCVCVTNAMLPEGKACMHDGQCASSLCDPVGGTCVTLTDGQTCNLHTQCASGWCSGGNWTTGVCDGPLQCGG